MDENVVVTFNAGTMKLGGVSGKTLTASEERGKITIVKIDGLTRFKWTSRDSSSRTEELDLIALPGMCVFKKIDQCTDGRVYMLEFSAARRFFFWMQDKSEENDAENCNKVVEALGESIDIRNDSSSRPVDMEISNSAAENPRTSSTAVSSTTTTTTTAATTTTSASAPTSSSSTSGFAGLDATSLGSILQNLGAGAQPKSRVGLRRLLLPELVLPILEDPKVADELEKVDLHLPPEMEGNNVDAVRTLLRAPQLQQGLAQFTAALESNQLSSIFAELKLPMPSDADIASKSGVELLIEALSKKADE